MRSSDGKHDLRSVRAFVFDLDGVIYRGNQALPGAGTLIDALRRAGVPFVFLTNNSTTSAADVAARLAGMGIAVDASEVLTSADVTAGTLAREVPGARVLVVGEDGLYQALAARGFAITDDHRQADVVAVGLDRTLTYAKLQEAGLAIRRGAQFVATNTDRTLPTPFGQIPGAGSLVAALRAATDVEPRVFGKPEPGMYLYALPQLGTPAAVAAAVGDRPETDILGAQRASMRTIAVLTGVGTRAAFTAMQPPPDWLFEDLVRLREAYLGA